MSDQTRRAAAEIVEAITAKMQANIEIVEMNQKKVNYFHVLLSLQ